MDGNSKKGEHDDGYLQLKHKIDINPKLESRAARQETITDRKKDSKKGSKEKKESVEKKNQSKGGKGKAKKKYRLIRWRYDNGYTIGSVLKHKGHYSEPQFLENKDEKDKYKKELRERNVKKKNFIDLPIGIELFDGYDQSDENKTPLDTFYFEEFRKLTQEGKGDDVRRSVLKIVGIILSSYLIRSLLKLDVVFDTYRLDERELRAMHVSVSPGAGVFPYLEQICRSVIIGTCISDEHLKLKVPTIIKPMPGHSIREEACLKVRGYKGYKWPAPYRDTSVLIDARAVRTKDIEQLARLNRWCSYIIFSDKKHQKKTDIFGYGEDIKGDILTNISMGWEEEVVHHMMTAYVHQLPALTNKKKLTDLWLQSGTYLRNHLNKTTSSKMKEAEKFKRHMEITAWITLLEFFQKNCEVSSQTVEDFKVSLLEVLLPGCTLQKADNTPIPQATRSPQNEFEDMLRKLLTQENLERFFPLPDKHGVVWLDRTLDSDMAIWGYIKYYAWSEGEAKIPCLVLLREQLLSTVDELGLRRSSFSDVLKAFQNKKPSYMHETLNAKVRKKRGERPTSITAYRLKISELPIEQSIIQALTDKATK